MNVRARRSLSLLLLSRLTLLSALFAVSGCGDDSKFATLSVELAAVSSAGCEAAPEEDLPPTVVCFAFELCRRTSTTCEPVALLRTGADHAAAGVRVLRLERSSVFSFDTRASGGALELSVTAYQEDGAVFATGTTRDITMGEQVRVRLERVAGTDGPQWSCAPGTTAGASLPRALHAATLLPGGQVLLYGGVFGTDVDLNGVGVPTARGATLQPGIEVYDPILQRIMPVTRKGSFDWKGRVLFASRLLPGPAAGPYVIALYGGYEADDRAALFLDANQSANATGTPIVPAENVQPGVPLLLTYDPRTRSVAIEANPLDSPDAINTGFLAVSENAGTHDEAVLVLGAGAFTVAPPAGPTATFAAVGRAFWLDDSGQVATGVASTALATRRMGATVTAVDGTTALLWGGSVDEADDVAARAAAGEVLTRGGGSRALQGGTTLDCVGAYPPPPPAVATDLPEPTVFHTATLLAPRQVLIAGGLLVGGRDCNLGITTLYPPHRPLTVVSLDPLGVATAAAVTLPMNFVPTIFHTATATAGGVVLVGGAGPVAGLRLASVAQVGLVEADGMGGQVFTPLAPLRAARWGHAATLLPGRRLLVTGGFETDATTRRAHALAWSEVLPLAPAGPPRLECTDEPFAAVDAGAGAGDGGRRDAGATDGGDADAGAVDAGM